MKTFKYTLFADGSDEMKIFEQEGRLREKIRGIFTIKGVDTVRHLKFDGESQMRQTLVIEADNSFTKNAIYIVMNSFKPQPLEFI